MQRVIMVGGTMNSGCIGWIISASAAVTSVMCLIIVVSMPTLSKGEFRLGDNMQKKITVCFSVIFLTHKK